MIGLEAFSNNAAILTAAQNSQQFNSMQAKKAEKSSKLSFADSLKKSEAEASSGTCRNDGGRGNHIPERRG